MKNKISDLNNHLFEQLERLNDEELSPEQLNNEIRRSEAMIRVSGEILAVAGVTIRAAELVATYGGDPEPMLQGMGAGKTIEGRLPHTPAAEVKMISQAKKK